MLLNIHKKFKEIERTQQQRNHGMPIANLHCCKFHTSGSRLMCKLIEEMRDSLSTKAEITVKKTSRYGNIITSPDCFLSEPRLDCDFLTKCIGISFRRKYDDGNAPS
ncbi:hypothetical protein eimer2200f10.tmp0051 [Eimeria tenella]|uniref:Uncharacterized protein n=1 Tax=Eimeria tenella TaxID=5802 RepID=C8TDT1_EIMTE|nr:hypothetical protein eimer2200f10.tmp0051 [Eimeria tenella]